MADSSPSSDPDASKPTIPKDDVRISGGLATADRPRPSRSVPARRALLAVALGLTAVALNWLILERFHPFFHPSEELIATVEGTDKSRAEIRQLELKNSAMMLAISGFVLAGLLGLLEGIRRRSVGQAALGSLTGCSLGGVLGIGAAAVGLWVHGWAWDDGDPLKPMALHGVIWLTMGIAAGLALTIPSAKGTTVARGVAAGALGGIGFAILYSLLSAFLFPLESSDQVIPTGTGNRLFWQGLACTLIAGLIAWQSAPPPTIQPDEEPLNR